MAVYRERSPSNFPERFSSPVLILQGLDDRVVPPAQAEAIVAALAAKGIPYAYLAFEGEGHGFRGAYAIRRTLEARLSFLGQVFGFEPADEIEPVEMPGLEAWRASHPRPVMQRVPTPAAERPGRGARRSLSATGSDHAARTERPDGDEPDRKQTGSC